MKEKIRTCLKHQFPAWIFLGLVGILGYFGHNLTKDKDIFAVKELSQHRQLLAQRKNKLDNLVEKVLDKAESYDGKRGMSVEDMANLAHELDFPEIIYEGDRIRLLTKNSGSAFYERVDVYMISQHLTGSSFRGRDTDYSEPKRINEQRLRTLIEE